MGLEQNMLVQCTPLSQWNMHEVHIVPIRVSPWTDSVYTDFPDLHYVHSHARVDVLGE